MSARKYRLNDGELVTIVDALRIAETYYAIEATHANGDPSRRHESLRRRDRLSMLLAEAPMVTRLTARLEP